MNKTAKNMLDVIPKKQIERYSTDENGIVTLEQVNKGITNKVFQILFRKPKISYIHLDELGSFVWSLIDGKKTIFDYGEDVKEKFGNDAEPLYERLAQYFQILESYKFIYFK